VRGEVFQLPAPRGSRGHAQTASRYAVIVRSDQLPLSTWLVAPTSTSARNQWNEHPVLAEQTAAVDPGRLGKSVGFLSFDEMWRVDAALRVVLDL
jgi:mRNA interferase MazF